MPVTGSTARPERLHTGRRLTILVLLVGLLSVLPAGLASGPAGGSAVDLADDQRPGVIHLTFDDGPHWMFTPMLLGILDGYGARASFFPTVESIVSRWDGDTTQDLLNRGHTIGNHTWRHADLSQLTPWDAAAELDRASHGLADLVGHRPSCFRAPYGAAGDVVEAVGARLGMSLVGWTADPQEWRDPPIGEVISYLRHKRTDGMVVLLHDRKWLTLQITRTLLDEFTREGWRFEALPACRPTGSQVGRVATRTPGDLPVGQVQRVWRIGDEVVLDGWAFDADMPDGGLTIVLNADGRAPVRAGTTDADHRFVAVVEAPMVDQPVCVWVSNAGRRRHDPSLGCHTVIAP